MALTEVGTEIVIDENDDAQPLQPAPVAALGNGNYVVVWGHQVEYPNLHYGFSILGQIYDANGNTVGGQFDISQPNADGTGHQWPAIVALEGGGFAVSWSDTNNSDIWARRFDASGIAQAGFVSVNQTDSGGERATSIAALANGGFAVSWFDDSNNVDIRTYDSGGSPTSAEQHIANASTAFPQVAGLSGGGFVAAWYDFSQGGYRGAILNNVGVKQGNDFSIATVETPYAVDVAAFDPGGGFVIVWHEYDPDLIDSFGRDVVRAQRFSASGVAVGGAIDVAIAADHGFVAEPQVTTLPNGGFAVTYYQQEAFSNFPDVYVRNFGASGVADGVGILVNNGAHDSNAASIDAGPDGSLMISWKDSPDWLGTQFADDYLAQIFAGAGAPLSGPGDDSLVGTEGDDTLDGLGGNDTVRGTGGNDLLIGGEGSDGLFGDAGNDTLTGGQGVDALDGGDGNDWADYSDKTQKVGIVLNKSVGAFVFIGGTKPANAEDFVKNIENVIGGSKADILLGDGLANVFRGGGGKDLLDGKGGKDTADYSEKTYKLEVTLDGATAVSVKAVTKVGKIAEDSIKNIENVTGGSAADHFIGDSKANVLSGNGGNDLLTGNAGKDTLNGGTGNDKLDGGAAADHYRFDAVLGPKNVDHIRSFVAGEKIELDDAIFAIGPSLAAGEFISKVSGHVATKNSQRIVYDESDGSLWYDSTGKANGSTDAIQFAILDNKPGLGAGDFDIV